MTRSDVGKGHPEYYQDMAERLAREIARRLLRQPVRQSRQSARARAGHRPGDLGADGPRRRCGRGGRRLRRHADRARALLRAGRAEGRDDARRPQRLGPGRIRDDRRNGARPARGWSRASARISCRRTATSPWCAKPTRSPTPRASPTARELLRKEAILAGSSSGTLLAAALRYCRAQTTPKRVVTFVCDSGNKYLSKMFNDYWMLDQGLLARDRAGRSARPDHPAPCRPGDGHGRARPTPC